MIDPSFYHYWGERFEHAAKIASSMRRSERDLRYIDPSLSSFYGERARTWEAIIKATVQSERDELRRAAARTWPR